MDVTEKKISALVEKYADTIFRLAYSYTKNRQDAEDVVQEVFIKIMRLEKSFDNGENEKAWILRVTINTCKDVLKQYWNKNTQGFSEVEETFYTDEYSHDNIVFEAVMSLDEQYRTVIHLYYYEGYKTPDISEIIGKREASVRSILHRARKQLKTILKEEYDFE